MSLSTGYHGLSRLFHYPEAKEELLTAQREVDSFFAEVGTESPARPFGVLIEDSTLAELQEDYVARFDFNPAAAPYLGHHLYGDNQKKGGYLIRVKQEFTSHGYAPESSELPDHLGVLLGFLAHLAQRGEDAVRRRFIAELVLPGVKKLMAVSSAEARSPWTTLTEAAERILAVDCEEVSPC